MSNDYTGWKLFDKITIVAKQMRKWDSEKWEYYFTDEYQGYIVDPSNKKQLESARKWGKETIFEYFTDENGNKKWLKCEHCDAKRHFMNRMDCKWSMIDWPKEKNNGKKEN